MNRHETATIHAGTKLVGLALAAVMTATLGCSDGTSGTPGTGGTTGSAGRGGTGGSTTGGTGGSTTGGTGGSSVGGTGGSTAGTGGATAGTGGSATGGTGGSTAGTGGSTTGGTGGSSVGGTGGTVAMTFPPTLNVPAGAALKLQLHAMGDQVYTCTASAAGGTGGTGGSGAGGTGGGGATTYAYVLKQPDAKLYQGSAQVGTHGAGPNWTSSDGSVVNGAKVYQENAPLSDAIPWLLLRATSNTGTGVFSDVTYVIRANTTGGKAPATGCDATTAGMDTRVAYTADYFFFNGGGPGAAWNTPPANLPAAIAVPSGATFKLHDHAIGVQVYTCTASAAGGAGGTGTGGAGGSGTGGAGGGGATTYSWVLKQPDAVLYDSSFAQVGTHGLGPNWTSTDGSVVNAARLASANSTVTTAIAWLLLQTSSTTGTGVFSDITYVQRLNTAGGPAPATGCDATTTGNEVRIPYSADYYFFTGGTTTQDGGTNG